MASITQLPEEVIYIILKNDCISIEDIVSFSSTCKTFRNILHLEHSEEFHWNKFWESKFFRRCYTARRKYDINKQSKMFENLDYKKQIQEGIKCIKKLQNYVFWMSDNKLFDANKDELQHLLYSIAEKPIIYYFVLDELNRMLSAQMPEQLDGFKYDLTSTYNLCLILHCLKQVRFVYRSLRFVCLPKKKQILEKFVTIVVQYFEPHISYLAIKTWLNNIAQEVLNWLKNKYPAYSICSTSAKKFSFWINNNINDTFWNATEARQIIDELKTYVFYNVQYIRNILCKLMMTLDLEDKYMEKFTGPFKNYLMVIICHCITRRLGISSSLGTLSFPDLNYSSQVAAFWIPLGHEESRRNLQEFIYPLNIEDRTYLCRPSMNFLQMVDLDLMRDCYSTFFMPNVDTLNKYIFRFLFKDILLFYETNYKKLVSMNSNVIDDLYKCCTKIIKVQIAEKKSLHIRKKEMKFAIGMIVTHSCKFYSTRNSRRYYKQSGVIIGWDHKCNRTIKDVFSSSMFPYLQFFNFNYHSCLCKSDNRNQPHYIILVENDKICYVREGKLSRCASKEINNVEIGHFLNKFEGNYYVPNNRLAKRYPHDSAAILQIFGNQ